MPHIEVSLSSADISAALAQLDRYTKRLPKKTQTVAYKLCERGAEDAKQNAPKDTGELSNSIEATTTGDGAQVVAGSGHAAFNEFGTGVVGSKNPYPKFPDGVSWQYDVNAHGEAGWIYIGKDGHTHWTRGLPSRPFMLTAANLMKQSVIEVSKEVFTRD